MFSSTLWSLLHFTYLSIDSRVRPPFFLQLVHPLFHPSIHPSIHTSSPGSLRQEVLQLQLSAKASLKGNSSAPWSLTSASRPTQILSRSSWASSQCMQQTQQPLTCLITHHVCFPAALKSFNSPPHTLSVQAAYIVYWLSDIITTSLCFCRTVAPKSLHHRVSFVFMHVMLEQHKFWKLMAVKKSDHHRTLEMKFIHFPSHPPRLPLTGSC